MNKIAETIFNETGYASSSVNKIYRADKVQQSLQAIRLLLLVIGLTTYKLIIYNSFSSSQQVTSYSTGW